MAITVASVLEDPLFNKCRLLTSSAQAEANLVRWVSVIEVPVERFVRRNEFVLTTAMNVGHDTRLLGGFVRRIADSGAAALAIAIGPYARTIPPKAVAIAEHNNLSLIEIRPWKLRFSEISERILQGVLEDQFLRKARDQFVWALATGRIASDERESHYAKRIGAVLDNDFYAIAALVKSIDHALEPDFADIVDEMLGIAADMAASADLHWLGTTMDGRIVAFVGKPQNGTVISSFLKNWLAMLKRRFPRVEVLAGMSDLYFAAAGGQALTRYADAAASALEIVELAAEVGGHRVAIFRDVAVDVALRRSAKEHSGAKLIEEYLGALVAHDRSKKHKLLPTLAEYVAVNCNVSVCARNLNIRRQSLMYRLERISAITGCDLTDATERFALQLALRMSHARSVDPTSGLHRNHRT
jgi:DNA-binding PucR family transcriptional regulator